MSTKFRLGRVRGCDRCPKGGDILRNSLRPCALLEGKSKCRGLSASGPALEFLIVYHSTLGILRISYFSWVQPIIGDARIVVFLADNSPM